MPFTVLSAARLLAWVIPGALAAILANGAWAQQNFGTLLSDLANRDRLAIHPNGAYSLLQASSYDRAATTLGAPLNYANADTANFLRSIVVNGQTEYVLMEDTGPGAITRWWMTGGANSTGQLRVYIDGQSTPVLSGRMDQLLSGSSNVFGSGLAFQSRPGIDSGHNLYAPIPYSSSVLVTYRGTVNDLPGWNPPVYYNIDYRKYAPGTAVSSYTASAPTTFNQQLSATNSALTTPAPTGAITASYSTTGQNLAAGQSVTQPLRGTGAIRRLNLKIDGADQAAALRNTFVELTFDGERTVQVPAGQFFGNGESAGASPFNAYGDFYRTVASNGQLTGYWVMPYHSAAEVRVVNRGAQNVTVNLQVDTGNWQWNANSMHFHADYRAEQNIATRGGNGTTDWTYLNVRGRGTYVGDTLAVRNGAGIWWGEGDEKVYVDYLGANGSGNNTLPDHVGTGSEDYYGYAWSHNELFSKPFIAQPLSAGNNAPGRSVNSRVRGLDAIPFDANFKFDMEIWHHASTSVDYGATTYWYGTPGAKSLRVSADLAGDYRAGLNLAEGGIPDRAGDGRWFYLSSSTAEASSAAAQTELLTYGDVGGAGHEGYGGGQNGHNLAAISDQFVFSDGGQNQGIQGGLGYHELAMHPAGNATGTFAGNASRPYAVARWVAGASSAGLANITGSVRDLVNAGDGVDFLIYVDGTLRFFAFGSGATLPEKAFDFDVTLNEGSIVDFVLGNNDQGNLFGDESLVSAMIWTNAAEFLPIEGDFNGDGTLTAADWTALRIHYGADLSRLSRRQSYEVGDINSDFRIDEYDFAGFKSAYEAAHGAGAFAKLLQVPEGDPRVTAALALVAFIGLGGRGFVHR